MLALIALGWISTTSISASDLHWPEVTQETKPWSRWWWLGNIGSPTEFSAEMEKYAAVGLGGLEITPIYGVRGYEDRFVPFLSDEWMDLLRHVLAEAKRLDLGIDMATGTGWPFGGPWVAERDASRYLAHRVFSLGPRERLEEPITFRQTPIVRVAGPRKVSIDDLVEPVAANPDLQGLALDQVRFEKDLPLRVLMAYPESGDAIDLTHLVSRTGSLDWTAPAGLGKWTLYALFQGWHGKQVERAGPGGEGNVVDHFSKKSLVRYLERFDEAFRNAQLDGLRAFFNDSYEVDDATGEADFTLLFFDEFERRRGYDLRQQLPALFGAGDASARVVSDYRETISDLLLDEFTRPWADWAHRRGHVVRNQAHGSPANLLDLYAASDIPEQEGVDLLSIKLASSAAHVTGRRLTSAEAATWINEHFLGTLGEVKRAVDQFLLGGVNHICYHGTAFSPEEEPWPGFQFYAAIALSPTNPIWHDFTALNAYITRAQSFLQKGRPEEDVLLYYNIHDRWAQAEYRSLPHFHGRTGEGMETWREAAHTLHEEGFGFDSVSDRMIANLSVDDGLWHTETGGSYKALVLPETRFIPEKTMKRILDLVAAGGRVVFHRSLPVDVPSLGDLPARRREFRTHTAPLMEQLRSEASVDTIRWGQGLVFVGEEPSSLLTRAGVKREAMVDEGLQFVRRVNDDGHAYFVVNRGDEPVSTWVPLSVPAEDVAIYDPVSGTIGRAATRGNSAAGIEVFLQVEAGASVILQTSGKQIAGSPWMYWDVRDGGVPIDGPWTLEFLSGGPVLPSSILMPEPRFWSEIDDVAYTAFAGTAVYEARFPRPTLEMDGWLLSLGDVASSCRVRLNGREIATLLQPPWRALLKNDLLEDENVLEIEVTNLAANRIAELDRNGVEWKKFYNINMPARLRENQGRDGLFSAAHWSPQASGLSGAVTLSPAMRLDPVLGKVADKPLFRDPVFDGAADPVVVWNPHVRRWWMYYTNRRANAAGLDGVAWVHGTHVGIAESDDGGATWKRIGTAAINLPPSVAVDEPTYWAPEVYTAPEGAHHMFLTVVPGVYEDWNHPRSIVHLTSVDLKNWEYSSTLNLSSDRVIDAGVIALPEGGWRMWYNDERDGKSIHTADSRDLKTWVNRGRVEGLGDRPGEGPYVFRWRNRYWMLVDFWKGLGVFRSDDLSVWEAQPESLLAEAGHGADDGVNGGHPGVVVSGDRAFLFYFTHPGRAGTIGVADPSLTENRRSSIQVVELTESDGWLSCNRDADTFINLVTPAS